MRFDIRLSPRQERILDGVAAGRSNSIIAEDEGISPDGVKWHVSELLGRTGLTNRQELGVWWRERSGEHPAAVAWPPKLASSRMPSAGLIGIAAAIVLIAALLVSWRLFDSAESNRDAPASVARDETAVSPVETATRPEGVRSGEVLFQSEGQASALIAVHPDDGTEYVLIPDVGFYAHTLSPDGTRVLGTCVTRGRDPNLPEENGVCLINVDGSNRRVLGTGNSPTWSPDGRLFAFCSCAGFGPPHLFVARADGSDLHMVAENTPLAVPILWSPDSRHLILRRGVDVEHAQIDIIEAERPHMTVSHIIEATPAFPLLISPSGERLLYVGFDLEMTTSNIDGSEPIRYGAPTRLVSAGDEYRWAPDSQSFAIRVNDRTQTTLLSIDATTTQARLITSIDSVSVGLPQWSPDGTRFAVGWFDVDAQTWRISIFFSRTFEVQRIIDAGGHLFGDPIWSLDGSTLYFVGRGEFLGGELPVHNNLVAVGVDGSGDAPLATSHAASILGIVP